jgi:hypothetical protein
MTLNRTARTEEPIDRKPVRSKPPTARSRDRITGGRPVKTGRTMEKIGTMTMMTTGTAIGEL